VSELISDTCKYSKCKMNSLFGNDDANVISSLITSVYSGYFVSD
jgi:hypothetical protein